MADAFRKGEKVQWQSHGRTVSGTVKEKLTEPTEIMGHYVDASEQEPQYLVVSDKTGAEAAHKPSALSKLH